MADVTPEFIAEARRTAEYEAERFPNDDWPPIVLVILDALEATERELRQRELHHFETEQMLAAAEARVAAAEYEALERAKLAIEEALDVWTESVGQMAGLTKAHHIVRDLMPRKDGV